MPSGSILRRAVNLRTISPIGRVQLILRLPSIARLSYRLVRDPRVPMSSKSMAIGAIALIFSPLDLPNWIPVIGGATDAFFVVTVLDMFIKSAPRDVVQEHINDLGLQNKFKI